MGPQKSRELYRVGACGSNQALFPAKAREWAQIAGALVEHRHFP